MSLDIESSIAAGRSSAGGSCRLLRRQFSLDRADEPSHVEGTATPSTASQHQQHQQHQQHHQHRPTPRLFKQNSAGAANDLERIEEVPSTPSAAQAYRHSASVSLSVESLTLR